MIRIAITPQYVILGENIEQPREQLSMARFDVQLIGERQCNDTVTDCEVRTESLDRLPDVRRGEAVHRRSIGRVAFERQRRGTHRTLRYDARGEL